METLYGSLMAVFLALFLATLFLLAKSRSMPGIPRASQRAYGRTSYRCSAYGTGVVSSAKFCGKCGASLTR